MSNRKAVCFMAALTLVALGLARQGLADPITVANPSFETYTTDWHCTPQTGSSFTFPVAATTGGLASTATDSYVGQIQSPDGGSANPLYQNLTNDFVAGTTYALTMAIGARNDVHASSSYYATSFDWTLSLNYADTGAQVAALSGTILNDATHTGFLTNETVPSYVASAADAAHAIQIRLLVSTLGKTSGGLGAYGLVSIDNVRLDATAAPEPSTLVLAGMGLLGLLAYAWRKRR